MPDRTPFAASGLGSSGEDPTNEGRQLDAGIVRRGFGLWVAPSVFLWVEWAFEEAPERVHWLMVPWACPWNDLVLWVRRPGAPSEDTE